MITTIIFDLGGVLFTNGTKRLISFVSEEYGIDKEKVKEVMDGEIGKKYREAKIDRHIFWNHFLTELGISANSDFLEEKWIFGYELIEETKEIIDDLRQKYKVYFLSDNVRNRVDKIHERYGFLDWFEGGIFSHEVGLKKPHPQLYKMILEKAGVNADEAVFVDDKEECLPPAKEIGMTAILFENPKKLKEIFEAMHLL